MNISLLIQELSLKQHSTSPMKHNRCISHLKDLVQRNVKVEESMEFNQLVHLSLQSNNVTLVETLLMFSEVQGFKNLNLKVSDFVPFIESHLNTSQKIFCFMVSLVSKEVISPVDQVQVYRLGVQMIDLCVGLDHIYLEYVVHSFCQLLYYSIEADIIADLHILELFEIMMNFQWDIQLLMGVFLTKKRRCFLHSPLKWVYISNKNVLSVFLELIKDDTEYIAKDLAINFVKVQLKYSHLVLEKVIDKDVNCLSYIVNNMKYYDEYDLECVFHVLTSHLLNNGKHEIQIPELIYNRDSESLQMLFIIWLETYLYFNNNITDCRLINHIRKLATLTSPAGSIAARIEQNYLAQILS